MCNVFINIHCQLMEEYVILDNKCKSDPVV